MKFVEGSMQPVAAVYDRRPNRKSIFSPSTVIDRRYRGMFLLGCAVALTACSSSVTPDKMTQIKPAMKTDQVEAILGKPAHIDHAETTGLQGDVYHYPASNGEGRVIFLNSAVFKAEFVPGAKS